MQYKNLRNFITKLENLGELKRVTVEVDPYLEITEICDRTLKAGGPALLFENVKRSNIPLLGNLFGKPHRVALGMGKESVKALRDVGTFFAQLKELELPNGIQDTWNKLPLLRKILDMKPKIIKDAICQSIILEGKKINLKSLPIQTCWPGDISPLITWGLVVTQGPKKKRQNLGIYRMQVIGRNRVIMRWLAHRGGALDYHDWKEYCPNKPFPISVALGADPATTLSSVTPIPNSLSEYAFAGLLRGSKTEVTKCFSNDLQVPANAEIILEGYIYPNDMAQEGPFGDHTGYYNEIQDFPVLTIKYITSRNNPIYHSTYTGRPPDEPSMLGVALNEVFIPLLQKQFPEVHDFYLPPEGCSYRMAIVSIKKQFPGHAKRIIFGIWSILKQFMYTKFIIVTNDDIDIRHWSDVIWAITTRMDPARDITLIKNTPIDYLDFASPVSGLGSKVGLDATNKWPGETNRKWGKLITMEKSVSQRIDQIWDELDIL